MGRRGDPLDIVQEAFLSAKNRIEDYRKWLEGDRDRRPLQGDRARKPLQWLWRIVLDRIIEFHRGKPRVRSCSGWFSGKVEAGRTGG